MNDGGDCRTAPATPGLLKTDSPLQQNSTTRQNHPISDSPLNIALTLYKKLKNRTFWNIFWKSLNNLVTQTINHKSFFLQPLALQGLLIIETKKI